MLNEITIQDKYNVETQKGKNKLPFDVFEKLCNLDPTTKPNKVGKYANWILAKYQPNTDFNRLRIALEWYVDGVKRGIAQRNNINPNIDSFQSYDELISTISMLSRQSNATMSNSEYNNRKKFEGQYEIVGSTTFYNIIKPFTWEAERYFGSKTEWCTVGNESYFERYMNQGPLYIIYPKNGDNTKKMQFHFESTQFADYQDDVFAMPLECIESVVTDENEVRSLLSLCKKIFGEEFFITTEDKIEALKRMTEIPDLYFYRAKIKEIVIPKSVTSIGAYAFEGCSILTSVTIPNSVTSIGEGAFAYCCGLKRINIPKSITSINEFTFQGCSDLISVIIPNGITSIGKYAFDGCYNLTSVTIPNSVTSIGEGAFQYCSDLISVIIPKSITSINEFAFEGCSRLTSVTIPNSVTSIGEGAFAHCSNLKKVVAPSIFAEYFRKKFGIHIIEPHPSELGSYTQESKQPICLSMTDIKQMVIETIKEIYKKRNLL